MLVLTALIAVFSLASGPAHSSVLISEMCDPQLNYPTDRFIEIYNSGPDSVDLTNWALIAVGNNAPINTWLLSGIIAPGQAKVAGNSTTVAVFTVDFPSATWQANNTTWNGGNGRDGAKLVSGSGAVIDSAVVAASTFADADYVRKPSIYNPNPIFTPSEWTSTPVSLATNASPGSHTINPPPPGPTITSIVTSPAFPLAGSPVHVQASVVDTVAAITGVTLSWGTTSGSLPNAIAMTVLSGSTYQTSTQIPAQVAGVTVYYKVQATDALSVTRVSTEQQYALHYNLTIAQIQGSVSTSPYNGASVITQGVVTSRFGTLVSVQDGAGAWNGIWMRTTATPAVGDVVTVRGTVTENDAQGYAGNTLLASGVIMSDTPGGTLPAPALVGTGSALGEGNEGVLVKVASATCTNANTGAGQWIANDGSGSALVDRIGYSLIPYLGTAYDVTGPVMYSSSAFKLEPRSNADIVFVDDNAAPSIVSIGEMSDSTLLVAFSEPVEETSAESAANYAIGALVGVAAERDLLDPTHVLVTIRSVPAGPRTLTVNGVEDAFGNPTSGVTGGFTYVDVSIPAGYYASAIGLTGSPLRVALHNIIKNHTVQSYDFAFTAYQTTDVKPNGKVWDMYSDVPGGTPPYEYTFDQHHGGTGEGSGYNREHSWPQAWFNSLSPMVSDLWIIYPTDAKVNEYRANYPYGVVGTASITSLNGSKVGPNIAPGYSSTVFEPINAYKGDLARSTFYVATRYFNEDAGWTGSPAASGANLQPWAAQLYAQWSANDAVSWKERLRNGAIYTFQNNRNPFVDHPEWVAMIFDSANVVAVDDAPARTSRLLQNLPNPFGDRTTIHFDLARRDRVSLRIYDVSGRLMRTLAEGVMEAGAHEAIWNGTNDAGAVLEAGLYFCRLDAGRMIETMRMVFVR